LHIAQPQRLNPYYRVGCWRGGQWAGEDQLSGHKRASGLAPDRIHSWCCCLYRASTIYFTREGDCVVQVVRMLFFQEVCHGTAFLWGASGNFIRGLIDGDFFLPIRKKGGGISRHSSRGELMRDLKQEAGSQQIKGWMADSFCGRAALPRSIPQCPHRAALHNARD